MGRYSRADRIAGQVHQILAGLIRTEIRDPRVGPLSITSVEVSGDLSVARVRFLPLGGVGDAEAKEKACLGDSSMQNYAEPL